MKVNLKGKYSAVLALTLISCGEFVHTQKSIPELCIDSNILPADGKSIQLVTISTDHVLAGQQPVWVTTSNGTLYYNALTESSTPIKDTLKIYPYSKQTSCFIQSSLRPDDNVILTVTINKLVSQKTLVFSRVCPTEIKVSADSNIVRTDPLKITLSFLRDDGIPVSQATRIDCTIDDPIATVTPTVYSNENGLAVAYLKPITSGQSIVRFRVVTDCGDEIKIESFPFFVE